MTLTILAYIFFVGVGAVILYSLLALRDAINQVRAQKALAARYEPGTGKPLTDGQFVAEALWGRAEILLQNKRFDAAFVDCKRVLKINPNHADARSLWKHFVPPEPVPAIPAGKELPLAAETDRNSREGGKPVNGTRQKQTDTAAPIESPKADATEEITGKPEPEDAADAVTLPNKAKSKLLLLLQLKYPKR